MVRSERWGERERGAVEEDGEVGREIKVGKRSDRWRG